MEDTAVKSGTHAGERSRGMTMIEIAITISLLALIILGVMGALSTGFMAQRNGSEILANQYHARRVVEEIQSSPFSSLLSFNGTSVTSADGKCQATIAATSVGTNLVRVVVTSSPVASPTVRIQLVTQLVNLN
jgi:Tfp pilus assembly protein PilV